MYSENARIPGTKDRSTVPRRPFDGRRQLCNIVEVRFEQVLHAHPFDCGDLIVRPGDQLVVLTEKGPQLAKAVSVPERRLIEVDRVRRVIRKASDHDVRTARELEYEARRAMKFALTRVRFHNLPMKLVVVEYMLDRSRALVYFTSESRVDFRNLVRELAAELRIRIEMRQIGVRDGTGVIGGIGPCGHELCCSSFLRDFQTVSIREPKEQGITLNPQRITGMCGRLKCCLLYEKQSYTAMRPFAPRADRSVMTAQGPASIVEVDTLSRKLQVRFPGGTVESLHMRELIVLDVRLSPEELQATMTREEEVLARRRQKTAGGRVGNQVAAPIAQDDYLWADVEQKISFFSDEERAEETDEDGIEVVKKPRRRRRGKGSATTVEAAPVEKSSEAVPSDGARKLRPLAKRARPSATPTNVVKEAPAEQASDGQKSQVDGEGKLSASSRRRRRRKAASSGAKELAGGSGAGSTEAGGSLDGSAGGGESRSSSSSARRRRRRRSRGGGAGGASGGEGSSE